MNYCYTCRTWYMRPAPCYNCHREVVRCTVEAMEAVNLAIALESRGCGLFGMGRRLWRGESERRRR